ncbi:SOS response-associated peptidase [Fibrobacterota bacterium]
MCGRFVVKSATEVIRDMFGEYEQIEQYEPSFNVAPSNQAPVFLKSKGKKQRRNLTWGLVPFFAKDPKAGFKMINARAETIHKLPSFRNPFRRQRCAVAADGFYEWRRVGEAKVPYYIHLKSGAPMVFAGIYDHWKKPEGGHLSTFSIATVPANELLAEIHNHKKRMPAVIGQDGDLDRWMDNGLEDPEQLLPVLRPIPDGELAAHIVTRDVNSPKNNHADLISPADDAYVSKVYGEVPGLKL